MKKKLRILIVDDDDMMAESLAEVCKLEGYETVVPQKPSKAIDVLQGGDIDVVVSDIKMPEMNGVELLKAVKKIDENIPVILITGYTHDEMVQEAMDEGVYEILFKPMNPDKFFEILKNLAN